MLVESLDKNVDSRATLVLSVTEKRGIVPQTEVYKKRIATDDVRGYKVLQPGDIAWNPYLLWTGAVGQWLGHTVGVTSPVYPVYRARAGQNPRFWGLVLESGLLAPYFDSTAIGSITRRRRTTPEVFEAASVQEPPLIQQRRIVDVVAAVDAQIEALTAEGERLANMTAVLRADYPDAVEVDLASVLLGIDSGKSVQTDGKEPRPDEARILKLSAVRPGRFDASEAKRLNDDAETSFSPSHLVSEGDLLVTRANTPERVGYVVVARSVPARTYMPDLIWRARVDQNRASADYLGHVLSSPEFRRRITGTAGGTSTSMVKINKTGFGGLRVPIPSLEAQSEYVAKCDAAQRSEQDLAAELAALRAFRSILLTSLLNQSISIPESYDALLEQGMEVAS